MAERERPAGVPAEAEFLTDWDEWGIGKYDDQHRYTGRWKSWRPDGTFCGECECLEGKLHGENRRIYEDGSVASLAHNEHGTTRSIVLYRPKGKTAEQHPFGSLPAAIVEIEFAYAPDGWSHKQVLRCADGSVVAGDGTPEPPRPASVPAGGAFLSRPRSQTTTMTATSGKRGGVKVHDVVEHGPALYWEIGEWTQVSGRQRYRGVVRHYAPSGQLVCVIYSPAGGGEPKWLGDWGDGKLGNDNPLIEAARHGDDAAVDELFALGLHASPHAALHAELEGLPALARRIREAGPIEPAIVDARLDQKRPKSAPEDALWVPGYGGFVHGKLDEHGRLTGRVDVWYSPHGYTFVKRQELDFVDGRRTRFRHTPGSSTIEQLFATEGPRAGAVTIERRLNDDGVIREETEQVTDGSVATRIFDERGRLCSERREQPGDPPRLISERWLDPESGARTATVEPSEPQGGKPAERFRGYRGDELVVEGFTKPGHKGTPIGSFQILAGGAPVGTVDLGLVRTSLAIVTKAQLVDLAPRIQRWLAAPTPPVLADLLALDWSELEGWFGKGETIRRLVTGLAYDDDRVFDYAMDALWEDVLHQSTISAAAGPVLAAALRLLPILREARRDRLFELVAAAWEECQDEFREVVIGKETLADLYTQAHATFLAIAEAQTKTGKLARELARELPTASPKNKKPPRPTREGV
jgi:hypothetical protein